MPNSLLRTLLAIGRAFVAILLCVSLAASVLLLSLGIVYEPSLYTEAVDNDTFRTHLYESVQEHLQDEALFYGIPYDVLKPTATIETVYAAAQKRLASVSDTFFYGTEPQAIVWESDTLQAAIQAYFDTLPFEERPLDTEAAATIAGEIADSTAKVLYIGLADKMVKLGHTVLGENKPLRRLVTNGWWLVVLTAVLAAVSMLGRDIRQRLYRTAGSLLIGSALAAVPIWLFVGYDFPAQLPLGDSALRDFVTTILYRVLGHFQTVSTVVFAVCAVLLIGSIIWVLIPNKKTTQ